MSLLYIWIFAFIIKVIIALGLPVSADESYYWVWAQHLDWSYFDHPPLVAYLIKLAEPFGNSLAFLRLPFVLLGQLTYLIWFQILKKFFAFNSDQLKAWLFLSLLSPLFGFGSMLALPDVPFIFFWSGSFYFLLQALQSKKISDYFWLGLFLGLGFCSKYHIVLFLFCILSILIFDRRWKDVNIKGVLVCIVVGLLACTPVLYWNFMNDWISFKFQLNHGLNGKQFKLYWPLSYLAGIFILTLPLFNKRIFKLISPQKTLFLMTATPFLFFLLTSFKAHVELNWITMAIPSFIALAVVSGTSKKAQVITNSVWGVIYLSLFAFLIFKVPTPFDESLEVKSSTEKMKSLTPLYTGRYQTASLYSYYLNTPVYKIPSINRFDYYDVLLKNHEFPKEFYYLHQKNQGLPQFLIEKNYRMEEAEISPGYDSYFISKVTQP